MKRRRFKTQVFEVACFHYLHGGKAARVNTLAASFLKVYVKKVRWAFLMRCATPSAARGSWPGKIRWKTACKHKTGAWSLPSGMSSDSRSKITGAGFPVAVSPCPVKPRCGIALHDSTSCLIVPGRGFRSARHPWRSARFRPQMIGRNRVAQTLRFRISAQKNATLEWVASKSRDAESNRTPAHYERDNYLSCNILWYHITRI